MTTSARVVLRIRRGSTYLKDFRFETEPYVYKPIQGITQSAPCTIQCTGHGLLQDQLFTVQNAGGMLNLNEHTPVVADDWHRATILDVDTIELNRINSTTFKAYTSGGHIRYRTVVDLTGLEAEMKFLDRPGGTVYYIARSSGLVTPPDPAVITLDTALQRVFIELPDEDTATFLWRRAIFDLDLIDSTGRIFTRVNGDVVIETERD